MLKRYYPDFVKYLLFGSFVFCAQWLLVFLLLHDKNPIGFCPYHIFLFVLTLVNIVVVVWLMKKNVSIMGYGFMALGFLKMLLSVLFLLPVILNKNSETTGYVIQFLVVYVIYLIYEVIYVVRVLKK